MFGFSCLYGFSLISSFVYKLFQLTLSQRQSIHIFNDKHITSSLSFGSVKNAYMDSYKDFSQSKSRSKFQSSKSYKTEISLNEKQKNLVNAMIKYSFLCIIAIVLYQCLFVIGPIIIRDYRMEVMYKFVFALAIFFEMLCIYLSFKINDSLYKCLCGKCHYCCEKWCGNIVEKKIQKINERTLDLLDTTKVLLEEVQTPLSTRTDASLNF